MSICVGHAILCDLSSSPGIPQMPERTIQGSFGPPPELTRIPPSPPNPPIFRADHTIAEVWKPEPPPRLAIKEETSLGVPFTTDSAVDDYPCFPPDPQTPPTATDSPRSMPPSEVRQLTSSTIPSSKIGRLFHYGGKPLQYITLVPQI